MEPKAPLMGFYHATWIPLLILQIDTCPREGYQFNGPTDARSMTGGNAESCTSRTLYTKYSARRGCPSMKQPPPIFEFITNSTRSGRPPISMIFELQVVADVSLEVYLERRVIPELAIARRGLV